MDGRRASLPKEGAGVQETANTCGVGVEEVNSKFFEEQACLSRLLKGCILAPNFVLGEDWVEGLELTPLGTELFTKAKSRLPLIHDAALVFAQFLLSEFDLISQESNAGHAMKAMAKAMGENRLVFPNNIGAEFHDECVRQFPSHDHLLTNEQTVSVLSCIPQGVYQVGTILVGPLGVSVSCQPRLLIPRPQVPGFLCSQDECFEVHTMRLSTNQGANVNEAIGTIVDLLRANQVPLSPSRESARRSIVKRSSRDSRGIFNLLVDGLSQNELVALVKKLYEMQQSDARKDIRALLRAGQVPIDLALEDLPVASLMQVALMHSDDDLLLALNEIVLNGTLALGEFEVRRERVANRWGSAPIPSFEVSVWGWRRVHGERPVALRLMQETHSLYFSNGPGTSDDLAYYLDRRVGSDEEGLLNEAVRIGDAERVVERILLAEPRLARAIVQRLKIPDALQAPRANLVQAVLWRLGGEANVGFDALNGVTRFIEEVRDAVRMRSDEATIRGHVANLFHGVEDAVRRALIFTTWALAVDHQLSRDGFAFDPDMSSDCFRLIEENSDTQESFRLVPNGKNSFAALAAGFARLAQTLEGYSDESRISQMKAGEAKLPSGEGSDALLLSRSSVQPRVFLEGPAYKALTVSSQTEVRKVLRNASALLGKSEVVEVRNSSIHPDNPFPSEVQFVESLSGLEDWVRLVSESGFFPTVYRMVWSQTDSLGRSKSRYESQGLIQEILEPTWHDTGRMPQHGAQLIFMPMARLGAPGALRFLLRRQSYDSRWADYPHRVPDRN